MKNGIEDLRNHLFATLEGLRDKDDPMDISRARAVSEVALTIIESAKVEYEYMKRGHTLRSKFVELEEQGERPRLESKLSTGGIYGATADHSPKLAAGIAEMRGKLAAKEPA